MSPVAVEVPEVIGRAPADSASVDEPAVPVMDLPQFLRLFQVRASQIMWFLGAGASRAAGVKTAWDMIWDFKQKLYCSHKKLPLSVITDLSDPGVQRKLQSHFDEFGSFPLAGAEDEYSAYFEATYPAAKDRQRYLETVLAGVRPSYGHRALALLIREGLARVVWTTNFDKLVEDSVASLFGSTSRLVVADLGEPSKLKQAFDSGRWPVLGKLHGDFHSETLKNTTRELRDQDADMCRGLVDACRNQGLAIVGYSGRDASVLAALKEAVDQGRGFPGGLFWFKRFGETPFRGVVELLQAANSTGVEARFVEVEAFDELMSDIVRFVPSTADKLDDIGSSDRPRLSKAPLRAVSAAMPVVRTNAIPITSWPTSCRLVACAIGGAADVRNAAEAAQANLEVGRVRAGVLAFGSDSEVRRAFADHHITAFETHAISPNRLRYESGERTLLRDALCRALRQRPGLRVERRGRSTLVIPDPKVVEPRVFNVGRKTLDRIAGAVPKTSVAWTEACGVRLDWRLEQLWLLLEPRVIIDVDETTPEQELALAKDFVRERRAIRRNQPANSLLDGWTALIVGQADCIRLRAFGIADGMDADFELSRITAFSGRAPS